MSETIAGLDIGTSKTVFIIVDESESGELCLLGFGESKTEGVVNGVIVNPEKAEKTILKAFNDAQKIANVKVKSVICCINGEHLKSVSSRGVITIPKSQDEITASDVAKVKKAAEAIVLPQDTQIIDSVVQDFTVDGQANILDPVGMMGMRLEANITMFSGEVSKVQNLKRALQKAGLEVSDLYPTAICSAEAVLTPEEKEVGIAMVDIGAGTTNVAIYKKGKPRMLGVIKYAGESISKDISIGLQLPVRQAEDLKLSNGFATQVMVEEGSVVNIPGLGGRDTKMISAQFLTKIIEARIEEILVITKELIGTYGPLSSIGGGVVFTGGSCQLKGLIELSEKIFDIPVRIGIPKIAGEIEDFANSPVYSAVIGSVIYHSRKKTEYELDLMYEDKKLDKFWNKIRKWLLRKL